MGTRAKRVPAISEAKYEECVLTRIRLIRSRTQNGANAQVKCTTTDHKGELVTVRNKLINLLEQHHYENKCAAWNCYCGATFGPPEIDGVNWDAHVADILLGWIAAQ